MLSQFPIFLDLHQTPPLLIGDDSGLAAKLRLLRKAAPLVIAISTSGQAPVLGQVIRARLESMLAPHYGKLAIYLNQLRPRLAGLAPAWRRQLQRQIITGPVGHAILQNDPHHADQLLDVILEKGVDRADDKAGHFAVIGYGSGDVTLLSLGAGEAIRGADLVFHDQQTPADILEIARREASFIKTDDALSVIDLAGYLFGHLVDHCGDATKLDKNIVWLGAGYSEAHQMLLVHLRSLGVTVDYWPAAQPAAIDDLPVLLPTNRNKMARVKAGLASKIIKAPMASLPAADRLRQWRGHFQAKFHDGDRP